MQLSVVGPLTGTGGARERVIDDLDRAFEIPRLGFPLCECALQQAIVETDVLRPQELEPPPHALAHARRAMRLIAPVEKRGERAPHRKVVLPRQVRHPRSAGRGLAAISTHQIEYRGDVISQGASRGMRESSGWI